MAALLPERRDLVLALLSMSTEREHVMAALGAFPWDSVDSVEFEPSMLRTALEQTLVGMYSVEDLVQWAEAIEVREDIEMTDARVRGIIHVLANPTMGGPTNATRLRAWIAELDTGNPD